MSFFHPERLLCGLLAILILLLYLGWRHKPIEVSTELLWRIALARRGAWRRWQRPISASLLILIVTLLSAALAEPYWRADYERARTIVVVLSNSASMRATDVAPDRLSRARNQARRLVDDLRAYEQMAVLTAGGPVRVRCSFTDDPVALRRAIDLVEPTDAPESVGEAIDLGRWMLAGRRNLEIVVLSAGNFRGAKELAAASDVTLVMPQQEGEGTAKVPTNFAITRLAARPSRKAGGCELLVEVGNFSPREAAVPLAIAAPGAPDEKVTLSIPADDVVQHIFSLAGFSGGMITAKLDVADDLAADNEARLMISPASMVSSGATESDGAKSGPQSPQTSTTGLRIINNTLWSATTTADVVDFRAESVVQRLAGPQGEELLIQPGQSRGGPLMEAGVWKNVEQGRQASAAASNIFAEVVIPVNLLDRRESDLRTPTGVHGKPLPLSKAECREPPGMWLLLLAIGLCGGEWLMFRLRRTV